MTRFVFVLLLLLAAYPLSYFVLLDPEVQCFTFSTTECYRYASFRGFGESPDFLQVFYKPLLALDQQWRPEYWHWNAGPGKVERTRRDGVSFTSFAIGTPRNSSLPTT